MELRVPDEPEGTWHKLKMAIEAAKKTIGYQKNKRTDWFDSNNDEMQDLLKTNTMPMQNYSKMHNLSHSTRPFKN